MTAVFNPGLSATEYTVTASGPGPLTYWWGWANNPGCGNLDQGQSGIEQGYETNWYHHPDCAAVVEATAAVLVCVQNPNGIGVTGRQARYGDGGNSVPGVSGDGVSPVSGTGKCSTINSQGSASPKPTASAGGGGNGPKLAGTPGGTVINGGNGNGGGDGGGGGGGVGPAGGTVVLVGGTILVFVGQRKKCNCDAEFNAWVTAEANLQRAKNKVLQREDELKQADADDQAAKDYWWSVNERIWGLEAFLAQVAPYLAQLDAYIAQIQQAIALDQQMLTLSGGGLPASDLSHSPKPGWVAVVHGLWARNKDTAKRAQAAGGMDFAKIAMDLGVLNGKLIIAQGDKATLEQEDTDYSLELRDLSEETLPEADDIEKQAAANLVTATSNLDTANLELTGAQQAEAAADAAYQACMKKCAVAA